MVAFILLIVLLIVAIAFFVAYPLVKKMVLPDKFNSFCANKIRRFAKKNELLYINGTRLHDFDSNELKINEIIFGKKYIYVIRNCCLVGEVKGEAADASWRYKKYNEKVSNYIDNLILASNENIQEFAGIIGQKTDIFVTICIIPDECDFLVKHVNSTNVNIVHFVSFKKLIKQIEKQDIGSLNKDLIEEVYKKVVELNGNKK